MTAGTSTQTVVSVSLGNTSAQLTLGRHVRQKVKAQPRSTIQQDISKYDNALGVPMDHSSAMSGYLKTSAKGYALVQYAIKALTQSDAKAIDWYLRAAEQGPSQAEFQLGVMYSGGREVLVDDSIVLYFKYSCN
ncbi:hypothetical protein BGZ89_000366 [Linnemannia elongata]|nr:hypothetical protein BGZ89_000366 [Linnemannia elongata]